MNTFTRIFLVLLRLSIGWLFLFEGLEKIESPSPWSSKGYLEQANGPFTPVFQWQTGGDADTKTLDRLTLASANPDAKATDRCSPALQQDYETLIQRYHDHLKFTDEQDKAAREKLDKHLEMVVLWLDEKSLPASVADTAGLLGSTDGLGPLLAASVLFTGKAAIVNCGAKDVESSAFGVTSTTNQCFRQRVQNYRDKLAEVRHEQNDGLVLFRHDVFKANLRTAKADAARMRGDLLADLEKPFRDSLDKLRTDEQVAKMKQEPLPAPVPPKMLYWTDLIVSYGSVIVGACLLLGLFTRLNCLAGALFLVMLYLALPAFPWLPENPKTEGHYLFVSKNIIMALALLALAGTRSGKWFGLDGLVQFLNPWNYRSSAKNVYRTPEKVPV